MVLGALPGLGLLLVVGGLNRILGDSSEPFLVPIFLAGAAILFIGVVHPRWWGPRWFRQAPGDGSRLRKTG